MKFISTLEIETYSIENPRQAQELIPQLLRKLIIDTIPKEELEKCDIPSRDDIIISGLDGSVVLNEKNIYIGNGKICIEIGTNKNCLTKANKDFKKRNETEENKQDKTFVFVTPIRWDNPIMSKGKWVEKNKGEWKDIRIVDAEALQNWLESSILTTKWFSKIIGKNIDDIENIDDVNEYLLDQTIYKFDLSFFDYQPVIKDKKIYPNESCPCGSGKKYKKCCGKT